MGKKNDNKELNAILAQLKKSYSSDDIDDSASSESEDDFQRMLSNYFSDADSDKDIYKFIASETPVSEKSVSESEYSLADFADFTVEETIEPVAEEIVEPELLVEENAEPELLVEEIAEPELVVEEIVEPELIIDESIKIDELIDETVEENSSETDDKAIVDDVFAAMFPSNKTVKTAYEELELDSIEPVPSTNVHNEHIARMFDLDEAVDEDNGFDVVDLPPESDAYNFESDDVVLIEPEFESEAIQEEPISYNDEEKDIISLSHENEESSFDNRETIDDIILGIDFSDDDIVLDMSAILEDNTTDYYEEEIDANEAHDEEFQYMSDPLQGHLSDAAFVSYKISDDDVNFDIDTEAPELDDEEISLLLDFGYDDEAEAEAGRERTNEIKRRSDVEYKSNEDIKIYGYCGEEYSSRRQNAKIKEQYIKDKKELLIKAGTVLAFSLILFFMSLVNCFAVNVNYLVYSIVEIIILGLISVIGLRYIKQGAIGLFKLEPNFHSVTAVAMASILMYSLFSVLFVCVTGGMIFNGLLLPCGFFAALYVLASILSEYLECLAEANTFDVVSEADELYTAEKLEKTKNEVGSLDKQFGRGLFGSEIVESHSFEVRKTSIPAEYFNRMAQKRNSLGGGFYILAGVLVLALIMGCVALITEGSFAASTYTSVFVILMGMPISFVFTKSMPKLSSSIDLKEKKAALVGDVASDEYSSIDTLMFDDECSIEIVKKVEIRPQADSDIASAIRITARAFKALGGPISKVIPENLVDENDTQPTISISEIRDNGIEFYMDSSVYMLIGDAAFMSTYGIRVSSDRDVQISSNSSKINNVIYIAIDGVPRLGYVINSKINDAFAKLVSKLDESGVKVAVSSYDPTVNDYYFEHHKIPGAATVSAYKPERFYDRRCDSIAYGGIFSSDDAKNIIHPITEVKRLDRIKKINSLINCAASVLGGIAAVLFVVFALLETSGTMLDLIALMVALLMQSASIALVVLNSFDIKRKRVKK